MDAARTRRLAERISKIVAEMLERRVKDPRLGFVTVTETRITNDLREATVFYTVYGSAEDRAETAAALKSATGIIRSEVGRIIGLRHTPSLTFVADELPDSAQHIEELVASAKKADEELARSREGAQWAGDPDPYRKPADAWDAEDLDAEDLDAEDWEADSGEQGQAEDEEAPGSGEQDAGNE